MSRDCALAIWMPPIQPATNSAAASTVMPMRFFMAPCYGPPASALKTYITRCLVPADHRRQRLEKHDQILALARADAAGVQAHHVAQRRQAAVVHVRRGKRDVAQARHAEPAEAA